MDEQETATEALRLGHELWIAVEPAKGRLRVEFQAHRLSGSWTTESFDLAAAGRELEALYGDLQGKVLISDNSSLGIILSANRRGEVTADIHVEGWPFKVQGEINFIVGVDHAQLLKLSQRLVGADR